MSEERMVVAPVGYLTVLKFPAQLPYYCMEQTGSEWMYCRKFRFYIQICIRIVCFFMISNDLLF